MLTPDSYVTINPAIRAGYYNVVIMRADGHEEYSVFRMSDPLKKEAADALARSWAAASMLEVRP